MRVLLNHVQHLAHMYTSYRRVHYQNGVSQVVCKEARWLECYHQAHFSCKAFIQSARMTTSDVTRVEVWHPRGTRPYISRVNLR